MLPSIPTERPRLTLGVSSHPQYLRAPAESASRSLPLPGRAARPRAAVRELWQQQERELLPPIPTERPRLTLGVSSHPQDLRGPAESASRSLPLPGRAARPRAAVRAVAAAGAGAAAADSHRATTAHTGREQSPTGPAWTGGVCQRVSASAGQGGPAPCGGAGRGSSRSVSCCRRFSPSDHGTHWA